MACFKPLKAYQLEDKRIVFVERKGVVRSLELACGQCIGCRLERSRQWAVRCMHEAQMHEFSSFVTLTYDDVHLESLSLDYKHFQLFMRRLRKCFPKVRFFMAGEYGDTFERPHFHAILFGVFFRDRELLKRLPSGHNLYSSALLSSLWRKGFCSVGDVSFDSAAYVARYCMKKVTGNLADGHYQVVDGSTGEIVNRVPEFARMSLKPGIGALWFERFHAEVFPRDGVVVNGVMCKPPRYYKELLNKIDVLMSEDVSYERYLKAIDMLVDNTDERLKIREAVVKSRLMFKKRSI